MQFIELDLNHEEFYCPVTGHHIVGDETSFSESKAMAGLWHDQCYHEPQIWDDALRGEWDVYYKKVEGEEEEMDLDAFLKSTLYDDYVCFKITTCGMGCGPMSFTRYFVFNMNFDPILEEEDELASNKAETICCPICRKVVAKKDEEALPDDFCEHTIGVIWNDEFQDGFGWPDAQKWWHKQRDEDEDVDLADYPGSKEVQVVTDDGYNPAYYFFGESVKE